MSEKRTEPIELRFVPGRRGAEAPKCLCFLGPAAIGVVEDDTEVPRRFAQKWAQLEKQREDTTDSAAETPEETVQIKYGAAKEISDNKQGVNEGGDLVTNISSRLGAIMDESDVEQMVMEGLDKGFLPRSRAEEALIHEAFMVVVKDVFPMIDPSVEEAIRCHSPKWLNSAFFDCPGFSPSLCYLILDYLFHAGSSGTAQQQKIIEGTCSHIVLESSVISAAKCIAIDVERVNRICAQVLFEKLKLNQISMKVFTQFKWVGFDLDHTLIDYTGAEQYMFYSVLRRIREADEFDEIHPLVSEQAISPIKYKQFAQPKGLFVDAATGNIIRVASNGKVDYVNYGHNSLSVRQIKEVYPDGIALNDAERFVHAQTRFESVFVAIVCLIASRLETSTYDWPDFIKKLKTAFVFVESKFCYYGLTAALARAPGKFCRKQPKVVKLLKRLRTAGVKLLLLTNAQYTHADNMMCAAYGSRWKGLFDVIVCSAKKKSFFDFSNETPLTSIPLRNDDTCQTIYCGGSFHALESLLESPTLYFGDHFDEDAISPNRRGWSTIAVAEMVEDNLMNPLLHRSRQPSWLYNSVEGKVDSFVCSLHMMAKTALRSLRS